MKKKIKFKDWALTQPKKAFTLVELMIVVLIIGILSSLAMASYSEYTRRSKVADAQAYLSHLKIKAEQFFGDRRTYTDFCSSNSYTNAVAASKYFTLTCVADDTSYTLTMTGKVSENMSGYAYSIDNANGKSSTVAGSTGSCWLPKPGATC